MILPLREEKITDKITLYNGDCLEGMSNTPDKFYDLAIVDPPYGIRIDKMTQGVGGKRSAKGAKKYKKGAWDNSTPDERYFNELFRVSKDQIIWGANYMTYFLPPSMGWIFWDKGQRICNSDGELAFTSFNRALRVAEYNRVELLKEGTIHPTQKPIVLYKWLLHNYAKPEFKVLDTHLGSMSSVIAAHYFGCELTGFEIDTEYFETGVKRVRQQIRQVALF